MKQGVSKRHYAGRTLRLVVTVALIVAAAPLNVFASVNASAAVGALATDGQSLGPSPQTGSILTTYRAGDYDVYYVDLEAGQVLAITATITGWLDLWASAPQGPGIPPSARDYNSAGWPDPEYQYTKYLTVQAEETGRYTIWLHAMSATYSLAYTIVDGAADDFIPGVPLSASPVSGSFAPAADNRDIYAVDLQPGERLEAEIAGAGNLYLLGQGTTRVLGSISIAPSGQRTGQISYLAPPDGGGTYYLVAYTPRGWYDQTIWGEYTLEWEVRTPLTHRLAGDNRYFTSVAASRSTFTAATVGVVAYGRAFPDALTASALAGVLDAPLILEDNMWGPSTAAIELTRLGVTDVYIIGGPMAISTWMETNYEQSGFNVTRIGGENRHETSRLVADEVARLLEQGGGEVGSAFLVRGDDFADALSAGSYAYSEGMPILLSKRSSLNSLAAEFIEVNDIEDVIIAGGASAISTDVAEAVAALNESTVTVERVGGATRYETAAQLAVYAVDQGWATWDYVGITTGRNYPDGLSASSAVGRRGGVLLLTQPAGFTSAGRNVMAANIEDVTTALVFGGPVAIFDSAVAEIEALFR